MNSNFGFILKIAIASLVVSALIKYGGQLLPLASSNSIALIIVLLPSIILALIFGLRYIVIGNNT
jgi:hypothetical protein